MLIKHNGLENTLCPSTITLPWSGARLCVNGLDQRLPQSASGVLAASHGCCHKSLHIRQNWCIPSVAQSTPHQTHQASR